MIVTPEPRRVGAVVLAMLLFAPICSHAAQRAFVSSAGSDAADCTLSSPCRGFAKALTVTDPGGEIVVVDSGGYGSVTVNKNVSILAPAGVYAGISVFAATDGITVTAPATKVVLRGLTINGQGGNNGIRVQAGELHVESTILSNLAAAGILVEGGTSVRISGTVARSNAYGLRVVPGAGAVSVVVRDSEFSNNTTSGVVLSPSAAGANALATVERTAVTRNGAGLVVTSTGSATAMLVVTQSVASENAGAGVSSSGAGTTVFVRESAITRNNVGFQQTNSGLLNACGGNLLVANATAQSGAIATASCLDVASAGGTVTSVATGTGLTGGPITAAGTINLAATQLLPTAVCGAGQVPKWNGSAWTCAADDVGASAWSLTGNSGTVPATNFLGTTDGAPLVLQPSAGNVGIGLTAPQAVLNVNGTAWFQGDSTPLPAAAGKGIAVGFGGEQGYIFGFDYATFTAKNLLLQNAGGNVGIGTLNPSGGRLHVESTVGTAVYASSSSGVGVSGTSGANWGVNGYSSNSYGVGGRSNTQIGVYGQSYAPASAGVYGVSAFIGTQGFASGADPNRQAVRGDNNGSATGYAGLFNGNTWVVGTLLKNAGAFQIDHPLDPANKYLSHSFVESPDMKNIYDGVVTTGGDGTATVELPAWFEALNRDFRYQLTVVGQFAQAMVASEIKDNHFVIQTDRPQVKVSWQVTGIRQDTYASAHRIQVEEDKPAELRGTYIYPAGHGQSQAASLAARTRASAVPPAPD